MRRVPMYMHDWIAKLHAFLTINDHDILSTPARCPTKWPALRGGRNQTEWVADFDRNGWPKWSGIRTLAPLVRNSPPPHHS